MAKRTRLQEWFFDHSDPITGGWQAFEYSVMSRKWAEDDIASGRETEFYGDPNAPKKATVPRYLWWCIGNWVWYHTKHKVDKLICKYRGHDLVDVSSGGPDSGNMDHECKRCGQYWHVPLY